MGWAMALGLLIWLSNWVLSDEATGAIFGSWWVKAVWDLMSVLALIPLLYLLFKGMRRALKGVLWRLRRRLIITYLLIGVLPMLLLLLLVAFSGYAILVQSSTELVAQQLEGYLEQSQAAAQAIAQELSRAEWRQLEARWLRRQLQNRADALAPIFPGITLTIREGERVRVMVSGQLPESSVDKPADASAIESAGEPKAIAGWPPWLVEREGFHGLAFDPEATGPHRVYAQHIIKTGESGVFQLSYPIGPELSAHLSHTTGLSVTPGRASWRVRLNSSGQAVFEQVPGQSSILVGEGENPFQGYPVLMPMSNWSTGVRMESDALFINPSFLLPEQIYRRLAQLTSGNVIGQGLGNIIKFLASVFLIITLLAIISAAFLTRSITGAVHSLYQGTKRVEAGDLEHEIPVAGDDQLSALALAFNQMTRAVRELLRVSAEKQRLDQEMRIAAEVQARLFPRAIPRTTALEIAPGVCIPAREVSGDYYDFFEVIPGVIGLALADVCGKGMSAALLMANLQANLRSQVQAYRDAYPDNSTAQRSDRPKPGAAATGHSTDSSSCQPKAATESPDPGQILPPQAELIRHSVRRIVQRANRQIKQAATSASFVTLFYAEFEESSSLLRYTNAGHNPPLLLRARPAGELSVERLECGGTVLGLFEDAEYEEAEVRLESGDVLVVFTDGLIEARNPAGEEFGEARLLELLTEQAHLSASGLEKLIWQSMQNWTAGAEQEDDMTLLILKKV